MLFFGTMIGFLILKACLKKLIEMVFFFNLKYFNIFFKYYIEIIKNLKNKTPLLYINT